MKGIYWNGDAIATKGTTASKSRGMFSVGNLVAFETSGYCSPDGSHHTSGCNLMSAKYFLQDEIALEEFDRTHVDKYGSGSFDKQQIINLRDNFCHEWENNWETCLKFLCTILDDNKPRLPEEVCSQPRIEEVRNNPRKFLHIYSIGDGPFRLAEESASFEDAVASINNTFNSLRIEMDCLEKVAAEKHALGIKFTEEGVKLAILRAKKSYDEDSHWSESYKESKINQIKSLLSRVEELNNNTVVAVVCKSAYYSKPDYHFVYSDNDIPVLCLGSDDHFGHAVRDSNLIIKKITKKVKLGDGRIYCGSFRSSTLIDVFKEQSGEMSYNSNLYTSWCNSQSWNESVHDYTFTRFEIESGEEGSMKEYNLEAKKRIAERKEKFENLSKIVAENFGDDILKLATKKKGKIIQTLDILSRFTWIEKSIISKALWESSSPEVLENIFLLVEGNVPRKRLEKARDKGGAWAYLNAVLPKISFCGKFDDVTESIKLYLKLF